METGRAPRAPRGQAAVAVVIDATDAEVKQLAAFVDGSIMVPEIRHHLWRSWGFCSRHTWLHAVVECELRARPFGTAILYHDLTWRAARTIAGRARPRSWRIRRLASKDTCFTCDYLELSRVGAGSTGQPGDGGAGQAAYPAYPSGGEGQTAYPGSGEGQTAHPGGLTPATGAPPNPVRTPTERVNARLRTTSFLAATRSEWEMRTCPKCLGGSGPMCRPHILAGEEAPLDQTALTLAELANRLGTYYRSCTWHGPTATPRDSASWVEALGWFAGWAYPAALALT